MIESCDGHLCRRYHDENRQQRIGDVYSKITQEDRRPVRVHISTYLRVVGSIPDQCVGIRIVLSLELVSSPSRTLFLVAYPIARIITNVLETSIFFLSFLIGQNTY